MGNELQLNLSMIPYWQRPPKQVKKDAAKRSRQHSRIHWRLSSTKIHLSPKVIFHQSLSSTEGCLPLKVIFLWRWSSTTGCLPPKVIFHGRSSSTEGCLQQKVVFHRRGSSAKGHLPPLSLKPLNKLTGTWRKTGRRTGPYIESGWRSD